MNIELEIKIAKKLIYLKTSANTRNLEFSLTLNDVRKLLSSKTCFYSGVLLQDSIESDDQRTIDRVDNSKGYITGNVVACSKYFNRLKDNLSIEDITFLYKGLKKKNLIK